MKEQVNTADAAAYLRTSVDDVRRRAKEGGDLASGAFKIDVDGRREWRFHPSILTNAGIQIGRPRFEDWLEARPQMAIDAVGSVADMVRQATLEALREGSRPSRETLIEIAASEKVAPGARISAAKLLLDTLPGDGPTPDEMTEAEIEAAIDRLAGQTREHFEFDWDRANRELFEDAPAPLKLEEGKFYQTVSGRKVGPMNAWSTHDTFDSWWANNTTWGTDGRHCQDPDCGLHIIAEWIDEPAVPAGADVKAEIADEAKRIVSGARRTAYGTPESNFERIARFWQAYLENTGRGDAKITAADVSPMMRLMKEARLCETPDHRDSFVDLVGYALTGAEVNGVQPLTADKPQV